MTGVAEGVLTQEIGKIHDLDVKGWELLERTLQGTSTSAVRILATFDTRHEPDLTYGIITLQDVIVKVLSSSPIFPDIFGVTSNELPTRHDGSSSIPIQHKLYANAKINLRQLLSIAAGLLRTLEGNTASRQSPAWRKAPPLLPGRVPSIVTLPRVAHRRATGFAAPLLHPWLWPVAPLGAKSRRGVSRRAFGLSGDGGAGGRGTTPSAGPFLWHQRTMLARLSPVIGRRASVAGDRSSIIALRASVNGRRSSLNAPCASVNGARLQAHALRSPFNGDCLCGVARARRLPFAWVSTH